ncbi:MAG TPA: BadF/BadG/BcrA/BcrD ATPase family protein [Propylenella sp.]
MTGTLFVGVDGGGTRCRARVRDAAGRLLGEGAGGPANVRLEPGIVMGSVLAAVGEASRAAGLSQADLCRAHAGFGLAGANLKEACRRLLAEPNPFASVVIETDAYAAWLGAYAGSDGAILILGTGSCGLAVVGGIQFYVGGWGAEVSDEASGQMLGREAIRRSLWAYDGRAAMTPLAEAILAGFGNSAEAIVAFATTAKPADFGRFVPRVFEFCGKRDPLALALVGEAAADAARIMTRLLDVGAPSICLLGGVAARLAEWLPPPLCARLAEPRGDAMDGAILMARMAHTAGHPASARG